MVRTFTFIGVANILLNFITGQQSSDAAQQIFKSYIFEGLNKDAKPCDNALDFFCGKWMSSLPIDDPNNNNLFENRQIENITDTLFYNAIKDININDLSVPTYKKWLRTYFDQCMYANMSKNDSIKQVFNGLQRVIGPPPILMKNKTAHNELIKRNVWNLVGQVQRKLGTGIFFTTVIEDVVTNCGKLKPILRFNPPNMFDDELNQTDIQQSVLSIANLLEININAEELNVKVDKMVALDNELRQYKNKTQDEEDLYVYDELNNTSDLDKLNPRIDWSQFFYGLFSEEQLANWNQDTARFQVRGRRFFQHLEDIVHKYDIETVFNYIFYKAMRSRFDSVASPDVLGQMINRVPSCVWSTKYTYEAAAVKLLFDYSKQNLRQWKSDLEIITDNVFTSFKSMVYKANWLTTQEKAAFVRKANMINLNLPIPDWLNSDVEVEKRSIKFDADKGLYDNSINIDKWESILSLDRFVNEDSTIKDMRLYLDSIGYVSMDEIQVLFPSILPPWYHFDYPLAAKYALIGNRIAETMLVSFSANHLWQNSPDGPELFNESRLGKLNDPFECMKAQMAALDCKDNASRCGNLDNSWMFTETVMQVDAAQIAYAAYTLATQRETSVAMPVKGLNEYNWDQVFHLALGRSYCKSYAMDSEEDSGKSRKSNRLAKIFRNLPTFAKSFLCSSTVQPCGLWARHSD